MKKVSLLFFAFFLGLTFYGFAQTSSTDFFAGPWEIMIYGTPDGDTKMTTTLTRVNGKLTGVLSDPSVASKPKMNLDQVIEKPDGMTLIFYAEGMDINIDLKKVDNNNLNGTLLGMFNATAKRIPKPKS